MNSTIKQLELRGYIDEAIEKKFLDMSTGNLIALLKSDLPVIRSIGARLLSHNPEISVINYLIEALVREKKLYSKIEICNSLVSFGKYSVKPLIMLLGKIGNNQYREIPKTPFKKISYPLPRDTAARTLIRIGEPALSELLKCLKRNDLGMLSEAIDAIGYICFYKNIQNVYITLKECFNAVYINDLIRWNLFRAMSSFPESKSFLIQQGSMIRNEDLKTEIERSLKLISEQSWQK
jgi:hypothetical protein